MDQPPLKDTPVVEDVDDDEDLAPHMKATRAPGEDNPTETPIDFKQQIETLLLNGVNPSIF